MLKYVAILSVAFVFQQDRRRKFLENLDKRAKKRQKLMSMKRYSGLLKRPEILETVYSVESEDGNEAGKADKTETDNHVEEDSQDTTSIEKEVNSKPRLMFMKRMESETTSYDWSTDSESLRFEI